MEFNGTTYNKQKKKLKKERKKLEIQIIMKINRRLLCFSVFFPLLESRGVWRHGRPTKIISSGKRPRGRKEYLEKKKKQKETERKK